MKIKASFNMQPVSTHSRLKAAGSSAVPDYVAELVSTHSRLKAAGDKSVYGLYKSAVSTHSRLKAAGNPRGGRDRRHGGFQHTAA